MLIKLSNTQKREEFLATFKRWPVCWSVPEEKITARRFELPGGYAVIAVQYGNDFSGGSNPRWQFVRPGGHFSSVYVCSSNVIVGELLRLGHIEVEVPDKEDAE